MMGWRKRFLAPFCVVSPRPSLPTSPAAWAGDNEELGIFAPTRRTTLSCNRPILVCILNSFAEISLCQCLSQHPTQKFVQVCQVRINVIELGLALTFINRLKEC